MYDRSEHPSLTVLPEAHQRTREDEKDRKPAAKHTERIHDCRPLPMFSRVISVRHVTAAAE